MTEGEKTTMNILRGIIRDLKVPNLMYDCEKQLVLKGFEALEKLEEIHHIVLPLFFISTPEKEHEAIQKINELLEEYLPEEIESVVQIPSDAEISNSLIGFCEKVIKEHEHE